MPRGRCRSAKSSTFAKCADGIQRTLFLLRFYVRSWGSSWATHWVGLEASPAWAHGVCLEVPTLAGCHVQRRGTVGDTERATDAAQRVDRHRGVTERRIEPV